MTGGEAHEVKGYDALMELCEAQPEKLLGDKGYDADVIRDDLEERGIEPVIPPKALVTKRSGKSCIVVRRQACHDRLANAVYHWARVAVQCDPRSRAKYAELRRRGHSHGRALRSVADRLLNVACAMLKSGAAFNPSSAAQKPA